MSKFVGFMGAFWFAGVIFSRGVWISKKEKPPLALDSTNLDSTIFFCSAPLGEAKGGGIGPTLRQKV